MKSSNATARAASSRISHIARHLKTTATIFAVIGLSGCITPGPAPDLPKPAADPKVATEPTPAPIDRRATETRYLPASFDHLPATADADWVKVWPAWMRSCSALSARDPWRTACSQATQVKGNDAAGIRRFFRDGFDIYRLVAIDTAADSAQPAQTGLATGYYEPLLRGSRHRTARYSVPLYRVPTDLVVVDLASVYPELSNLRLRGRLQGQRLVPYATRGEIESSGVLSGQELLWVDDPVAAFFLHVQGSGRVQLDDGTSVRVGYAESNGHPYRSIGRRLIAQGELTLEQASMQGIKAWAARNGPRIRELLAHNPSFVFFRESPVGDATLGPRGAMNVALTPERSVAVDPAHIPLGAALVLTTTHPSTGVSIVRPVVAQDTGGAIRGPLRFDFFWGYGDAAGEHAGRQRHQAAAWLFVPKGVAPQTLVKR